MSDDGNDLYVPDFEEPTMEIVVETLTGTTFEMTVAPEDTIMSIKSKIQRVEGIPVSQQHLLHRLKELHNEERLCDHGITAGTTLRLVLSMRGGPISTRRLASNEHHLAWREFREYVDTTRDDMLDKLPAGSKVTMLLFRDGENINLIRVVENEDGTFSDSWPSTRNVARENSQVKHKERSTENNLMMHKVIELRRKMEGLSMQKKAKKPSESKPNLDEPSTSRLNEESLEIIDNEEYSRLFEENNNHFRMMEDDVPELYSDRFLLLDQRRNSRTNLGRSHRPHRLDSSLSKSEDMSRNCASIQTPNIAILEEEPEPSLNKKDSEFSPPSPISVASGDANTITMSQIPSLPGSSRNLLHLAHVSHVMLQEHEDRPKTSPDKYDPKAQEFCNVIFNDAAKLSVGNRRQSVEFSSNKPNLSLDQSNLLTSQYASTSKLNKFTELSNLKFSNERSALYGRRARIERIRNNIAENSNPEKYGYSNFGYVANIEKIQNDSSPINKKTTSHYGRRSLNFVSNLESRNGCDSSYELRPFKLPRRRCDSQEMNSTTQAASSTQHLPAIVPKKPPRTRCEFCNKRLNITTIHTCRCGGIFCSQHRYSEVHGCHYDYKTEGRKILEQANPLVAAPKLPKI